MEGSPSRFYLTQSSICGERHTVHVDLFRSGLRFDERCGSSIQIADDDGYVAQIEVDFAGSVLRAVDLRQRHA